MSRCKSCGAHIEWVKTSAGRPMPVDPELKYLCMGPGRDVLVTDVGSVVRGSIVPKGEATLKLTHVGATGPSTLVPVDPAIVGGRTSHFATCPNAKEHRRG